MKTMPAHFLKMRLIIYFLIGWTEKIVKNWDSYSYFWNFITSTHILGPLILLGKVRLNFDVTLTSLIAVYFVQRYIYKFHSDEQNAGHVASGHVVQNNG